MPLAIFFTSLLHLMVECAVYSFMFACYEFLRYFAEIKWILSPYYVILLFLVFRCKGADTVAFF